MPQSVRNCVLKLLIPRFKRLSKKNSIISKLFDWLVQQRISIFFKGGLLGLVAIKSHPAVSLSYLKNELGLRIE